MHSQRPPSQVQNSTTSFLTATTLIYAIGAGITAAAGHQNQVLIGLSDRFVKQHLSIGLPYGGISTFLKPEFKNPDPHLSARYDG